MSLARQRRALCAGIATLPLLLLAAPPTPGTAGVPWGEWTILRLRARPLFLFSGEIEMELSGGEDNLRLETRTRARFLGATIASSRTVTTLDAKTGRTLSYTQSTPKRGRRYTFGESAYTVEKLKPAGDPDAPLHEWKIKSVKEFAYPEAEGEGPAPTVFDYYGMILHLRDAPLDKPGDAVTLYVATSDGPRPYRIEVGEVRRGERVFVDLRDDSKRTEEVREFRLRISPSDPGEDEEGFLEMEGETEIWVEAKSRTLLEIEGKIPRVPGRVEVTLAAIR